MTLRIFTVFHLLALLAFSCKPNPQAISSPESGNHQPILSGDTVTLSEVSDHYIGHGEFRLTNPGPTQLSVEILSAELVSEGTSKALSPLHFTPETADASVPAGTFQVAPNTTLPFTISFPAIAGNPYFNSTPNVRLNLRIGENTLHAQSVIVLQHRLPLR